MLKLVSHKYVIWTLLTVPVVWLAYNQKFNQPSPGAFFYWTGVLSGLFAIASLAITPITRTFKSMPGRNWLIRQRRYLGLSAFGYVIAHTAWWVYKAPMQRIMSSFWDPVLTIAWVNLVIYLALAMTSNDWSVRKMGPNWKKLQSWTYFGTFLGLLHWFWAMSFPVNDTVMYGGLFILLMLYRVVQRRSSVAGS